MLQVCNNYLEGRCRYGDQCRRQHVGDVEMKPVEKIDEICNNYQVCCLAGYWQMMPGKRAGPTDRPTDRTLVPSTWSHSIPGCSGFSCGCALCAVRCALQLCPLRIMRAEKESAHQTRQIDARASCSLVCVVASTLADGPLPLWRHVPSPARRPRAGERRR